MTTSRTDAEDVVKAVRYPPAGERFWGPFYAPLRWGMTIREYLDRANDEVLAVGVIEHIDAVENAAQIAATPGLDLVFIGPGDLATSMGLLGRGDHPDVRAAIAEIEKAFVGSPVALGGVAMNAAQAKSMMSLGYRALMVGFDWSLLQRGIVDTLNAMRNTEFHR